MRVTRICALWLLIAGVVLVAGCDSQMKDLRIQNRTQRKRIAELESELKTTQLQIDQLTRQLDSARGRSGIETDSLQAQIAALQEDLEKKKALIASMQQKLLFGGAALPVELSTMLEDFARDKEMVTYDPDRGVVKFKSDLLFDPGSDRVAAAAADAVKGLCEIMNSEQGSQFDIIIAGHTDDMPIAKAHTRRAHPTNWHLSAHRAIAVLDIMADNKIAATRMSIRGFGEYRPVEPNKPGKKGNSQNRRVEIYIVSAGT
jgi:chemotaxis protein MotB